MVSEPGPGQALRAARAGSRRTRDAHTLGECRLGSKTPRAVPLVAGGGLGPPSRGASRRRTRDAYATGVGSRHALGSARQHSKGGEAAPWASRTRRLCRRCLPDARPGRRTRLWLQASRLPSRLLSLQGSLQWPSTADFSPLPWHAAAVGWGGGRPPANLPAGSRPLCIAVRRRWPH